MLSKQPAPIASPSGKYSDAVEAPEPGRFLFFPVTPGLTSDGHLPESLEEQAEQAWKSVLTPLERAEFHMEIEAAIPREPRSNG